MTEPLFARVHGAGPTGVLAALALLQAGWRVSLVDPLDRGALLARNRGQGLISLCQVFVVHKLEQILILAPGCRRLI